MAIIKYNPEWSDLEILEQLKAAQIGDEYHGIAGKWIKIGIAENGSGQWQQVL